MKQNQDRTAPKITASRNGKKPNLASPKTRTTSPADTALRISTADDESKNLRWFAADPGDVVGRVRSARESLKSGTDLVGDSLIRLESATQAAAVLSWALGEMLETHTRRDPLTPERHEHLAAGFNVLARHVQSELNSVISSGFRGTKVLHDSLAMLDSLSFHELKSMETSGASAETVKSK